MAKFENLTLSYTQIASIPFKTRKAASGSLLDALSRELTPGQRVALFPSYVNKIYASGGSARERKDVPTPESGGGPPPRVDATVETAGPPRPSEGLTTTREIIPAGLIPDPVTGKPTRVPDQQKLAQNASAFTPRERAVLDMISRREGSPNPDIIFGDVGGKPGSGKYSKALGLDKNPLSKMTIAQVFEMMPKLKAMTKDDEYGRLDDGTIVGTTAVGSGQMIKGTLEINLKALGIKEEDYDKIIFDETLQNKLTLSNFKRSIGDPNGDPSKWNQTQLGKQYESFNVNRGFSPLSITEIETVRQASPDMPLGPDTEFSRLETVYDLPEEIETAATAEPVNASVSGADSIIPLGAETDAVLNPEKRVVQKQKTEAKTRKGEITDELENTLALTSQRTSESTGRNLRFEVTSGGQRMEGAPGSVGTHQHDQGGAADFSIIEVMPDGTERELKFSSPEDRKIINEAAYQFGKSGGKTAGSEYPGMGNKIHFGIPVKDDGLGPRAYEGSDAFREAWQRGHSEYLQWAKENKVDPKTGHTELFNIEKAERIAKYEKAAEKSVETTTTQQQATVNSDDYAKIDFSKARIKDNEDGTKTISWNGPDGNEISQTIQPDTLTPDFSNTSGIVDLAARRHYGLTTKGMVWPEPEPVATATAEPSPPEPTYTMRELTGTGRTLPGHSAAAGGAEITDPSMIISEDGKKVTRVAETGPEKISVMPRHKSSDVFQENQSLMQEARQEQSREEAAKPDIATVKSSPQMSDFGRSRETGQSIAISTVMPRVTPSANKAFADAKMVGRFNKAGIDGDMGIVYIDRGYA